MLFLLNFIFLFYYVNGAENFDLIKQENVLQTENIQFIKEYENIIETFTNILLKEGKDKYKVNVQIDETNNNKLKISSKTLFKCLENEKGFSVFKKTLITINEDNLENFNLILNNQKDGLIQQNILIFSSLFIQTKYYALALELNKIIGKENKKIENNFKNIYKELSTKCNGIILENIKYNDEDYFKVEMKQLIKMNFNLYPKEQPKCISEWNKNLIIKNWNPIEIFNYFIKKIFNFYNCQINWIFKNNVGINEMFGKIKTYIKNIQPFVLGEIPREEFVLKIYNYKKKYGENLKKEIIEFLEIFSGGDLRDVKIMKNIKIKFIKLTNNFLDFSKIFNEGENKENELEVYEKNENEKNELSNFYNLIKEKFQKMTNSIKNYLKEDKKEIEVEMDWIEIKNCFGHNKNNFFNSTSTKLVRQKRRTYKSPTTVHNHYYFIGSYSIKDTLMSFGVLFGIGWLYLNFWISIKQLSKIDCSSILPECMRSRKRRNVNQENNDKNQFILGKCPPTSTQMITTEMFISMLENNCLNLPKHCLNSNKRKKRSIQSLMENCGAVIAWGWSLANLGGVIYAEVLLGKFLFGH